MLVQDTKNTLGDVNVMTLITDYENDNKQLLESDKFSSLGMENMKDDKNYFKKHVRLEDTQS